MTSLFLRRPLRCPRYRPTATANGNPITKLPSQTLGRPTLIEQMGAIRYMSRIEVQMCISL